LRSLWFSRRHYHTHTRAFVLSMDRAALWDDHLFASTDRATVDRWRSLKLNPAAMQTELCQSAWLTNCLSTAQRRRSSAHVCLRHYRPFAQRRLSALTCISKHCLDIRLHLFEIDLKANKRYLISTNMWQTRSIHKIKYTIPDGICWNTIFAQILQISGFFEDVNRWKLCIIGYQAVSHCLMSRPIHSYCK